MKTEMEKQLRRSKQDSVLGGVAGGLAKYLNVDVVIVRLILVVSLFISFGVSLFAYLVLWVVLPVESFPSLSDPDTGDIPLPPAPSPAGSDGDRNLKIIAIGLIGFGTYLLLDQYIIWYNVGKFFWPLALIGIGAFLLLRKRDQDYESSIQKPPRENWEPVDKQSIVTGSDQAKPSPEDSQKNDQEDSFKVN